VGVWEGVMDRSGGGMNESLTEIIKRRGRMNVAESKPG
jgi:hypothetical protein